MGLLWISRLGQHERFGGAACGKVTIPAEASLSLWCGKQAAGDLSPLATLGPNDLQQLRVPAAEVLTNADLLYLRGLTGLQVLWLLNGTQITDAGLAHLSWLTALQELSLDGTQITDAGLAHLRGLTALQELSLGRTRITDAGLAHLSKLTELQGLWLGGTDVTDGGLASLRRDLPTCRIES